MDELEGLAFATWFSYSDGGPGVIRFSMRTVEDIRTRLYHGQSRDYIIAIYALDQTRLSLGALAAIEEELREQLTMRKAS